jgi:hypothetical protein
MHPEVTLRPTGAKLPDFVFANLKQVAANVFIAENRSDQL